MFLYGGFWRRVVAALIDGLLVGVLSSLLWFVLGFLFDASTPTGEASYSFVTNSLSLILGLGYYSLMESSPRQATVGKIVMGLTVADEQGNRISFQRAAMRYLAKYLSATIFMIGFIMVAFTEKKQGLHDKLVNTVVVRK